MNLEQDSAAVTDNLVIENPVPDWPRAHGGPLFTAELRREATDFQVIEQLGWEMSSDGEHDYLWVEKTGANTDWVAQQLARYAGVPVKDVGFAGLKDRHAVTLQWFSVPRWHSPEWQGLDVDGVRLVDVQRHLRKLRRGAHKGNAFRITLRHEGELDRSAVEQRLDTISAMGVPNYFGEQRFGRNGSNLKLVEDWAAGRKLPRHKRSLAISVARSWVFNEALAARVGDGTWDQLVAGESANLEGSGSIFTVDAVDDVLLQRCRDMDIHPAGLLPGDGSEITPEHWQAALNRARVEPAARANRLRVLGLNAEFSDNELVLSFALARGAFATTVLRELCRW